MMDANNDCEKFLPAIRKLIKNSDLTLWMVVVLMTAATLAGADEVIILEIGGDQPCVGEKKSASCFVECCRFV